MSDWMREYGTAEQHARTILDELEKAGGDRLVANYSGGNDEGGVEDVSITRDGAVVEVAGMDWEHPLWGAVNAFLATKYYTWAGDFSASGEVFAEASERRVWAEGSETQYVETVLPDVSFSAQV